MLAVYELQAQQGRDRHPACDGEITDYTYRTAEHQPGRLRGELLPAR